MPGLVVQHNLSALNANNKMNTNATGLRKAAEMINYTKFNILQQASQAMPAQANQQPQAVLRLLG